MGGLKCLNDYLKREIAGIFLIAISILLLICLFSPSVGIIPYILEKVLRFLVGEGRFAFPAAAFYLGFKLIRGNVGSRIKPFKGGVILFLVFLVLMNILTLRDLLWNEILNGNGGGLLGAVLYAVLVKSLGQVGSIVILTAFTVVGIILCTNLSFRMFLKKTSLVRKKLSNAVINFLFEEVPADDIVPSFKLENDISLKGFSVGKMKNDLVEKICFQEEGFSGKTLEIPIKRTFSSQLKVNIYCRLFLSWQNLK